MYNQGSHSDKYQRFAPDAYSLLSWKDTTSLCQYDTFDEYLKAQCKQLICINQTLQNKIKSQQTSIQYLLKTIQSKDAELQKMGQLIKKDQNSKTIKKGNSVNQFGNILTAGVLSKSINHEFPNEIMDYHVMIQDNKKLIQRISSQEVQLSNYKTRNMQLAKQLQLAEHQVINFKQKLLEENNLANTIQKLNKSIEQKNIEKQQNKNKLKSMSALRDEEIDILREELKDKKNQIQLINRQYQELQIRSSEYKRIAEQETKRSDFLSKNLIQLTTQFKNDKKKLEQNIFNLQCQLEKQQFNEPFYQSIRHNILTPLGHNRSLDKAQIKIIQSCQSEESEFQGFKLGKKVGSIKTRSVRQNERAQIQGLIDRYYRIKANNF